MYTNGIVTRLLRNYFDIRYTLIGKSQQLHDNGLIRKPKESNPREKPLGYVEGGGWPFREPRAPRTPRDGKAKARFIEELHCSLLDLEEATKYMSDDDLSLLYQYHVLGMKTLDELAAQRGNTSRGSMQRRIDRAVNRLVRQMNKNG